jgi:primary-amine oxidase
VLAPRRRPPARHLTSRAHENTDTHVTYRAGVTAVTTEPSTQAHPLDPLDADEIRAAAELARGAGLAPEGARFARISLDEPTKDELAAGGPLDRRARITIVPGLEASVLEVIVSLTARSVLSTETVEGARPALLFDEAFNAIVALHEHEGFAAALARRGITDLSTVQIDPWPAGTFGIAHEEGRRLSRCICYLRHEKTANGYARPIEGLLAIVDVARGEVVELVDTGPVPIPDDPGSYYPDDNQPLRTDIKPIEITQPEGPGFTLEGHLLRWGRWSVRLGFDPYEGLVLHTLGYEDGGRVRPILHRASIAEMVVPYGDPGPLHGWKNAFDAGEWGLGRMANSLALGCDCVGVITYVDAVLATEAGDAHVISNAICLHEEDFGILWKHVDALTGKTEVRRQRRMVISSIATVGNYEYGFYWYLYLDGSIQLEVKLTGILSTQAFDPAGPPPAHSTVIAPGLASPHHQHLFCARLDVDVDGPGNEVHEVDVIADDDGDDNPWANAFRPRTTVLATEQQAQREVDPSRSRVWKVVNPSVTNGLGQPVSYKLLPGATPTLLAGAASSVGRRAAFARHNLWVTPYAADERRAAGEHPNQSAGGDGLPAWTAADRKLDGGDVDVVLWHTFGVTHVARPEDWPVMPVESVGFHLVPVGFFDRNPTLDVPPPAAHCHE